MYTVSLIKLQQSIRRKNFSLQETTFVELGDFHFHQWIDGSTKNDISFYKMLLKHGLPKKLN